MAFLRYALAFVCIAVVILMHLINPSEAQARGSDAILADHVTGVLLKKV